MSGSPNLENQRLLYFTLEGVQLLLEGGPYSVKYVEDKKNFRTDLPG